MLPSILQKLGRDEATYPMTADKLANAISRIKKSDLKVYRTKGVHNDHYHIYIEVTDYFKEKKRCG